MLVVPVVSDYVVVFVGNFTSKFNFFSTPFDTSEACYTSCFGSSYSYAGIGIGQSKCYCSNALGIPYPRIAAISDKSGNYTTEATCKRSVASRKDTPFMRLPAPRAVTAPMLNVKLALPPLRSP